MQADTGSQSTFENEQRDLFFQCDHCGVPLVVDAAAAGMSLECQRCGKPTTVPAPEASSVAAKQAPVDRLAELQRHLKENASQRTEINGYINQLSIQLHRWQLRLETLEKRQQDLNAQIAALGLKLL